MPAMSISPVKSGVGGIGTRKRFSAASSLVASATVQAPLAMRRKVVPRSSTRKPGARACVERLSVWSRFSMGLSQDDDGLCESGLFLTEKAGERKALCCRPREAGMKQGRDLKVGVERFPIRGGFTISRGAKHEAVVVVATIRDGAMEEVNASPTPAMARAWRAWPRPSRLARLPSRPASTAMGFRPCAAAGAQRARLRAVGLRGEDLDEARPSAPVLPLRAVGTAFTISLAAPEEMAARAREAARYPCSSSSLAATATRRVSPPSATPFPMRGSSPMPTRRRPTSSAFSPRQKRQAWSSSSNPARRRRRSLAAHRPHRPGLRRRVGA